MGESSAIAEVVARQLEGLLEAANYDGAKLLLQPVQPVDAAEAIGTLPRTLQALAFRLLPKDEAIEVYEYLDPSVQQTLELLGEHLREHGAVGQLGVAVLGAGALPGSGRLAHGSGAAANRVYGLKSLGSGRSEHRLRRPEQPWP